jgi:autotransporter family porin
LESGVNTAQYTTLTFAAQATAAGNVAAEVQVPSLPSGSYTVTVSISGQQSPAAYFYITPGSAPTPPTQTTASPTPARSATPVSTATPTPSTGAGTSSGATLNIFADALGAGWQNWSWDAGVNWSATSPVYSGSRSLGFNITKAWGGLYLHLESGVNTAQYTTLTFAAQATGRSPRYAVALYDTNNQLMAEPVYLSALGGDPVAGSWKVYNIPVSQLGANGRIAKGVLIQDGAGARQPIVYIDAFGFKSGGSNPPAPTATATATPVRTATPTKTATAIPTQAPTATVTPPPAGTQVGAAAPVNAPFFQTLGVGAALPTSTQCAAAVHHSTWEPRPENITANHAGPMSVASIDDNTRADWMAKRVDGNFTGTTDEILQWASCKWGFDDNITRAQAAVESWWRHGSPGDWEAGCGCYVSFGILQIKRTTHPGTYPQSEQSTAFNADYALAWRRACYEGAFTWLNTVSGNGAAYQAGDVWGCLGLWYSGRWYDAGAQDYINKVQRNLEDRPWLSAGF